MINLLSAILISAVAAASPALFEVKIHNGDKISTFQLSQEGKKYFLSKDIDGKTKKTEVSAGFVKDAKEIFQEWKTLTSDSLETCDRNNITVTGFSISKEACLDKKSKLAERLSQFANTLLIY